MMRPGLSRWGRERPQTPGSRGALSFALTVTLAGCNQDPGADNGKGIDEPTPCPECAAVSGVVQQGYVIPDFSFQGFIDPQAQDTTPETITLYDFFNPHAGDASYHPADPSQDDRLFPPGSPYGAGTKKPLALFIDIASVWCGPCNEEAKSVLNGLYAKYKPCGGEFLFQLAEGGASGIPATLPLLRTWVSMYHVSYPSTWDRAKQLQPLYSADSFPDSAIVDTRTMEVVKVVSGVADATFWATFEGLLEPSCISP